MRVFVLARHGQSLLNVAGLVNGDPARDPGLSAQGTEEARRLAGQLAAVRIDLAVVSPFPRVLETTRVALAGRAIPIEEDDDLGDVRLGELEGSTVAAYRAHPAHADRTRRFPGGESLDEAALRYARAFERLLARAERVTLVATHEIPLRYAVNGAAGSDRLDGPAHDMANAAPDLFDETTLGDAIETIRRLAR